MAWSVVLSLLFLFMRAVQSNPMLTPKKFEKTNSCSNNYLVEGNNFILIEFEATGSNSTYPLNDGFYEPKFYYTLRGNSVSPCNGFILGTNTCTDRRGKPGVCSCLEVEAYKIYRLTNNMTAERMFSKQSIWMECPGPPALVGKSFQIPEIRANKDSHGLSLMWKIFIGVGLVVLLASIAGVGFVYNNTYVMSSTE